MYFLLFFSALSSATLLPGSSEVLLLSLSSQHPGASWALWAVATLGNTLGGIVTYAMGWWGLHLSKRFTKLLPSESQQQRALPWLQSYAWLSLGLSWVPIIGDGLCLLAGIARFPIGRSILAMFIGKAIRYAVLLHLAWFITG